MSGGSRGGEMPCRWSHTRLRTNPAAMHQSGRARGRAARSCFMPTGSWAMMPAIEIMLHSRRGGGGYAELSPRKALHRGRSGPPRRDRRGRPRGAGRRRGAGRLRIAGIEEVGRGPLAGPVVAAVAVIDRTVAKRKLLRMIDDSKKLTVEEREEAYAAILESGVVRYAIGEASVEEIDAINILQATFLA